MIAELIRLADLNGLTGCEPTRLRRIHWFIDLNSEGQVVGFSPTTRQFTTVWKGENIEERGKLFSTFANYYMQWKSGKVQGVCTNQNDWLPDFLSGSTVLIFKSGIPGSEDEERKRLKKHEMWCDLVLKAVSENPANKTIAAVANFVRLNADFSAVLRFVPEERRQETTKQLIGFGEKLSFRIQGKIALTDPQLAKWWASLVAAQRQEVTKHLPVGSDNYLEVKGALTESFPRFKANIALASFDAAPFVSYGLGNQTTTLRIESAEKTAAGLRLLLDSENTSMTLGEYTAIFWAMRSSTRNLKDEAYEVPFVNIMAQPDPLSVRDFLNSVWGSHPGEPDESKFYAALLRIPSQGRFSLHSWHSETLDKVKGNIQSYFRAVALGDSDEEIPSIKQLALATIAKSKKQKARPDAATVTALFQTSLFGEYVPHRLLVMAILRQKTELAGSDSQDKEFKQRLIARTSLMKLFFATNKEGEIMNAEKHEGESHPAYLCGRLLALLDKIHDVAHDGKSASSPANRLYGAASKTPALVFPQLCSLARYHLNKMEKGMAFKLEYGVPKDRRSDDVSEDFEALAAVFARLKDASGGNFPRILSLEEQGRFAIGFYYERCQLQRQSGIN